MELLQIDGSPLADAEGWFRCSADVFVRENFFDTDAGLEPAIAGSKAEPWWRYKFFSSISRTTRPTSFLAVAVAIGQRGVDEVDPQIDSAVQGAHGLIVVAPLPLGSANAPSAKSNVTDGKAGFAKCSVFHPEPMIVKECIYENEGLWKLTHRVVILGGGFGGLYAAKALRKAPVQVDRAGSPKFPSFPAVALSGGHRIVVTR